MIPVLVIEDNRLVRLMVMDLHPVTDNAADDATHSAALVDFVNGANGNGHSNGHGHFNGNGHGNGRATTHDARMTNREHQIVQLLSDGLSNKEIAKRLHIATNTVKGHVHNILEKLSLRTRLQIVAHARSRF